jgi:hypothetical protein
MSRQEYDLIIKIKSLLETNAAQDAIYFRVMNPQATVLRNIQRLLTKPQQELN